MNNRRSEGRNRRSASSRSQAPTGSSSRQAGHLPPRLKNEQKENSTTSNTARRNGHKAEASYNSSRSSSPSPSASTASTGASSASRPVTTHAPLPAAGQAGSALKGDNRGGQQSAHLQRQNQAGAFGTPKGQQAALTHANAQQTARNAGERRQRTGRGRRSFLPNVESLEDIQKDLQSLEKEIALEIQEISLISLE